MNKIIGGIIVVIIIAVAGYALLTTQDNGERSGNNNGDTTSSAEKAEIEAWIEANNLNEYGDPEGTMYTGGTPLFNEQTGERIGRYQYIKSTHPDEPWSE